MSLISVLHPLIRRLRHDHRCCKNTGGSGGIEHGEVRSNGEEGFDRTFPGGWVAPPKTSVWRRNEKTTSSGENAVAKTGPFRCMHHILARYDSPVTRIPCEHDPLASIRRRRRPNTRGAFSPQIGWRRAGSFLSNGSSMPKPSPLLPPVASRRCCPPRPSPLSHYSRAFLPSTAAHNPLVAAALVIPSPDATATHYRNRFQPCPLLLPPSLPCSYAAIPYCSPRCPLPQHSASPTTVAATQPRRCPLPQPSPFPVAALVVPCRNPRRPQPLPSSFSPLLQSSPIAAVARSCFLLCCRSNCPIFFPTLLPSSAAAISSPCGPHRAVSQQPTSSSPATAAAISSPRWLAAILLPCLPLPLPSSSL
ncbi:hypothetical protein GW17_00016132 [Ensete ventricosum]|nr:hypothetical protein GW17_00016132 [Ensete ventricosum]